MNAIKSPPVMWGSKLGAMMVLAVVGLIGAYIPIFLRKCKVEKFICFLNTFAAGAFLGLAIFHIMPEAAELLEKEQVLVFVGKQQAPFNVAFILIFVGFVVILLCEQVLTVDESDGNSALSPYSEQTTPGSLADAEGGEKREAAHGEGGRAMVRRQQQQQQEDGGGTAEAAGGKEADLSPPAAAAAKGGRGAEATEVEAPAAGEAVPGRAAGAAASSSVAAAAASDGGRLHGGALPCLNRGAGEGGAAAAAPPPLDVVIMGGRKAAAATAEAAKEETAGKLMFGDDVEFKDRSSNSNGSSRRESVCNDELRGGGCGLGFPCCLIAAAAARKAKLQRGGGRAEGGWREGSTSRGAPPAAITGYAEGRDCIYNVEVQENIKTTYVPSCCVLRQRHKHPRDSTRASVAGSDVDTTEYKDEGAAEFLAEGEASAAGSVDEGEVRPGESWSRKGESRDYGLQRNRAPLEKKEVLEQTQLQLQATAWEEGKLLGKEGGGEWGGKQLSAETEKHHKPAVAAPFRGVAISGLLLGSCAVSSTLHHPLDWRDGCSSTCACEPAAETKDTATILLCAREGRRREEEAAAALALARGRGRGETAGAAAVEAAGSDAMQGERCAVDLRGGAHAAAYRASSKECGQRRQQQQQQDQTGFMCKWWRKEERRREGTQRKNKPQHQYPHSGQEDKAGGGGELERRRTKSRRRQFCCCRWSTPSVLRCSLPSPSGIDGGSFFLMAALAIHGLFEGVVVGAENNLVSLWIVTSVIAAHKWAESLLLMAQFMERRLLAKWAWTLMAIFVLSSPTGVIVGAGISNESRVAAGVCNALGAGTLLFVAAEISMQIFAGERKHRLLQLLMYCAGAGMVFGLTLLDIALEPADAGASVSPAAAVLPAAA